MEGLVLRLAFIWTYKMLHHSQHSDNIVNVLTCDHNFSVKCHSLGFPLIDMSSIATQQNTTDDR